MRAALFAIAGALFGAGLVISGMTDPGKVIGFLDVGGRWDPSLALVMGGAVLTFAAINQLVHRRCQAPLLGGKLPGLRGVGAIDARLLIGAALFGLGWALAGVCPGPGLVNLARLRPETTSFVGAMLVGVLLAQRGFGADAPRD